jgi:hypothetical protein
MFAGLGVAPMNCPPPTIGQTNQTEATTTARQSARRTIFIGLPPGRTITLARVELFDTQARLRGLPLPSVMMTSHSCGRSTLTSLTLSSRPGELLNRTGSEKAYDAGASIVAIGLKLLRQRRIARPEREPALFKLERPADVVIAVEVVRHQRRIRAHS